ncbi:MAG: Crp/Fnr family transcriptional regulator [Chloroflexi bacterium]|nr:Crp/Fnr family transcriptional regulator [Chloroflexota bacterium]MBM3154595.1 Crp/Fnr family transcriptional regulator [Chloroflexota bacterium]MBM3172566.1 Crp/Fnr family transcriptional regulator [Chloroflexota bacterium]MBM3175689.1 Crp/Fnr family transcriptional regulator [Chloroflexota bacterium]MBM4451192.1 Crp/Fnr family transcriptional regulator [Chloroflexota bacterium]
MAIQIDTLKSIPYFAGLGDTELKSIATLMFEKRVDRGEMLLLEGEPADEMYFVAAGVVKIFKTSADGKEQILDISRPGASFADVPVFDGGPAPASAQAMGPVVVYGIRRNNLETIIKEHPRVALNMIKVLAARVRHLISLVEDLSFKRVIGRVAKILLEHAGNGAAGEKPRLTQQDMAAMAGTAREVIGRSLKALEEEGAIRLDRSRIVIINKQALKETMESPA